MQTATVTCLPPSPASWQPWQPTKPASNTTTIFRLYLLDQEPLIDGWYTLLQPSEQQRAHRFRHPADRYRFILGRGLFRWVASLLSAQNPLDVQVHITPNGKPFVANLPNWHLNVSHAGDWVLLVVSQSSVGIDVEFVNRSFDINDLASSMLNQAEQQALSQSSDPHALFFEFWTRKEALTKATGQGMDDNFSQIPALEGSHTLAESLINSHDTWRVVPFFVEDAYPAALAYVYIEDNPTLTFFTVDPMSLSEWVAMR